MIRLTDEEVDKLSEEWLDADEDVDWATMMNKAQLKKVYEWGTSGCPHGGCLPGGHYELSKSQCSRCWQVLLEEME